MLQLFSIAIISSFFSHLFFVCLGSVNISVPYHLIINDESALSSPVRLTPHGDYGSRTYRRQAGDCEFGPCVNCPHSNVSPPRELYISLNLSTSLPVPRGRSRHRLSIPLEGITGFGGDLMGFQSIVNHIRLVCNSVTERMLPVVHVQPMLRVLSMG